jgi:hypothetical protein
MHDKVDINVLENKKNELALWVHSAKHMEEQMNSHRFAAVAVLVFAFSIGFEAREMPSEKAKDNYPHMAPVEQYLMTDRNAEIALARSAAPESISHDATVLVLGQRGYETAVEGKNGFVCVVERGWMSPADAPEFWNPKIRGPICFNPPAARSVLPTTYKRTEMVLAGRTKAEIIDGNKAIFEKGELPALEPGAMSYMMSKKAYLTDTGDHNVAHLMFYTPLLDGTVWGADLPKSPVMLIPQFKGAQPIDVFIVPVGRWSDGTAAPVM